MGGRVLVCGPVTRDAIGRTAPGSRVFLEALAEVGGGRGANTAAWAAALGAPATLVSIVGAGDGDAVRRELAALGVGTDLYEAPGLTPRYYAFLTGGIWQRAFYDGIAPDERLRFRGLLPGSVRTTAHDALYTTFGDPGTDGAALAASTAPLRLYAPGPEIAHADLHQVAACLERATHVLLNEDEAAALGTRLGQRIEMLRGDLDLAGIIVTLGSRGSRILEPRGEHFTPAFDAREVDPTGAGDAFAAGVITALLEARPLAEAARLGSAAAAFTVERLGARTSIRPRADIDARALH